ncbi:Calmodulin-binding receptor-like cytoplasmic kinase 3 [Acorus calamus]|uniref:Calmodulin-binding receptor-like cytoplasmic kinase 3 n=1 Tax=Acorus calamus TaxID=4465 RepID=A0AAV9DGS9_ACOCL|nr:Calmodulin-binding receptor-like cytoplasmic kinase 3 [Acorus calamus]
MSPREVGEMVSVIVAFMFRRLKWLFRFPEQSFCVVFLSVHASVRSRGRKMGVLSSRKSRIQGKAHGYYNTRHCVDSVSSFEVSKTSEKFPSSPHRIPPSRFFRSSERIPGSPQRVPPSPSRVPPSPSRFSLSPQLNRVGSMHLSVNQIMKGEGGFGAVYKAELPGGQVVAVKRAKKLVNLGLMGMALGKHAGFGQENIAALRTEFSNEVELLAKIDHLNLVKLLGYVEKGNERIIITEYVTNGTLREHLDGLHGVLDFNQRLQIAIDVAHALTYLHLYAELKRPTDERIAVRWAFKTYNDGNVGDILDPRLEETVDTEVLSRLLGLAFQCAAPTRSDRPTMQEVGGQLWEIRKEFGASLRRE